MGKSNVNPNHYTQAGRERQGEDVVHELERHKYAQNRAAQEAEKRFPKPAAVPPPAPVQSRKPGSKPQVTDVTGKSGLAPAPASKRVAGARGSNAKQRARTASPSPAVTKPSSRKIDARPKSKTTTVKASVCR